MLASERHSHFYILANLCSRSDVANQVACRVQGNEPLDLSTKNKVSMFCHVGQEQVLSVHNVSSVYHVPLLLKSQGIIEYLQKRLNLTSISIPPTLQVRGEDLGTRWKALTQG